MLLLRSNAFFYRKEIAKKIIQDTPEVTLTWEDIDLCLDRDLIEYGIPKFKVQTFKAYLKRKHQPAADTTSGGS